MAESTNELDADGPSTGGLVPKADESICTRKSIPEIIVRKSPKSTAGCLTPLILRVTTRNSAHESEAYLRLSRSSLSPRRRPPPLLLVLRLFRPLPRIRARVVVRLIRLVVDLFRTWAFLALWKRIRIAGLLLLYRRGRLLLLFLARR